MLEARHAQDSMVILDPLQSHVLGLVPSTLASKGLLAGRESIWCVGFRGMTDLRGRARAPAEQKESVPMAG